MKNSKFSAKFSKYLKSNKSTTKTLRLKNRQVEFLSFPAFKNTSCQGQSKSRPRGQLLQIEVGIYESNVLSMLYSSYGNN